MCCIHKVKGRPSIWGGVQVHRYTRIMQSMWRTQDGCAYKSHKMSVHFLRVLFFCVVLLNLFNGQIAVISKTRTDPIVYYTRCETAFRSSVYCTSCANRRDQVLHACIARSHPVLDQDKCCQDIWARLRAVRLTCALLMRNLMRPAARAQVNTYIYSYSVCALCRGRWKHLGVGTWHHCDAHLSFRVIQSTARDRRPQKWDTAQWVVGVECVECCPLYQKSQRTIYEVGINIIDV